MQLPEMTEMCIRFFLQMIIKTFLAVLAVVLEAFGVYCEGEFKWTCG